MSDFEHLDISRSRDLTGRRHQPHVRRLVVTVLAIVLAAAALGAVGQGERTTRAAGHAADLSVTVPATLRSGLLWRARIVIDARRPLHDTRLVLGSGFTRGMQVNTIAPEPTSQTVRDARLVLHYGELPRGRHTITLQFQVDATTAGGQDMDVALEADGHRPVREDRSLTVLP